MKTRIFNLTIFLSVTALAILTDNSLAQSDISATTEKVSLPTSNSAAQTAVSATTEQVSAPNNHINSGSTLGNILNFLVAILGGGTIGGLISMFYNARQERNRRRAELLDSQLRNLYGPLQFFTSSNQNIYRHAHKIVQAGGEEFGGENTPEIGDKTKQDKIQATIDLNNEYFEMVKANNNRMIEILTNNYALIEYDDAEIFAEFLTHNLRRKIEFDESGRWTLPVELCRHVGDIYLLKPEFGQLVNRRFMEKKAELERLLR